ncbi:MAG: class I SAM-dependent methyltransferase [Fimbriimonadaceae bacterium]|nr:class I SAM-dependent methyltransferase [Fimbriimonadaceae bacterium]
MHSSATTGFGPYYDAAEPKPLHPILESARPWLTGNGLALDLGAGTGKTSVFLADLGYQVVAVEPDPEGLSRLHARCEGDPRITVCEARFEDFDPPKCQAAVSILSLFFLERSRLDPFLERLLAAIEPGGVFVGQLLGPNDTWVADGCAGHTRSDVEALFASFDLRVWDEVEKDAVTVLGDPKHWHVHHIVATKRQPSSVDMTPPLR